MTVLLVLARIMEPVLMESINTTASVLLVTLAQTVMVISSFDFVINVVNDNGPKKSL